MFVLIICLPVFSERKSVSLMVAIDWDRIPGFSNGGSNAGAYIHLLISAVSVVFKALNFQLQYKHSM